MQVFKSAPNLHQICIKSAPNLHQICTKSASNLHQLFISFHQICTNETLKTYLEIVFETGKDDVLGSLKYRYMISSLCPKHTLNMFFPQLQNPHVQTLPDLPMSAFGTVDHYLTPSPLKRLPRLYFAPRL